MYQNINITLVIFIFIPLWTVTISSSVSMHCFQIRENKLLSESEEQLLHLKNLVINTTDPQMTSYYLGVSLAV